MRSRSEGAMSAADSDESGQGEGKVMTLEQAMTMALERHRAGAFVEAADIYRQILAVSPDYVDALHFLGVAEHQAGRPGPALDCLDRAIALAPDHPDARCNRGNVHRLLGHLDAAESDYRHALERRPDDPNTQTNLALLLRTRGDWEGAVRDLQAVVARFPTHDTAWLNLANTLQSLGRHGEAVAAYEQVAKLAPESAIMFRDMALALCASGRLQEAVSMYTRCLTLAPEDARARHLLAACSGHEVPTRAADAYVRDEFNAFAATFDDKLARLEYCGPQVVDDCLREIATTLPVRPAVLDAGCGTGLCAPLLRPLAGRLVGVDLSTEMVALARKRGGYDDLVVAELTTFLREHAHGFDVVVMVDTLVYFGALDEVVEAAFRALRPAGALVLTLELAEPGQAAGGFALQPSGRYAHTRDYVDEVVRRVGMTEVAVSRKCVRKEANQWVDGWLVRARTPA
jgi:predicted TPR repeat methyltransferase